jgi:hypothetical protein
MAWTDDGASLALGHYDGSISVRDKAGAEKMRLGNGEAGASPVWSLAWNQKVGGSGAVQAAACRQRRAGSGHVPWAGRRAGWSAGRSARVAWRWREGRPVR